MSGNSKTEEYIKEEIKGPITALPITGLIEEVERYPILEPFVYTIIGHDLETGKYYYLIDELKLNEEEINIYNRLVKTLQLELKVPRGNVDPRMYFEEGARSIVEKYRISMGKMENVAWSKILYYVERDIVGFGPLDPLMRDLSIEDISVDGAKKPVYVFHSKYESMPTNLVFEKEEDLDDYVVRLIHISGKHISTAFPLVDATLPGRHRLMATYRQEITPFGSTVTIRKFRTDPVTIVDMLNYGTLNEPIAAYLWLMMENRLSAIVIGATAAGKTTLLNALVSMVRPGSKVITIEEVQEMNLALDNWVPMISRPSYGLSSEKVGEVSLFDLVKASLRMRPDVLVVGEVRGEEAYVLFQAISTGHGGLCTIHAEDVRSAIKRLTSKPMDVAPSYIPFLDLAVVVHRVVLPGGDKLRTGRRVISVEEIIDVDKQTPIFEWTSTQDKFREHLQDSSKIRKLAEFRGVKPEDIIYEIRRRELVLNWLKQSNIRHYTELQRIFTDYYYNPDATVKRASEKLRQSLPNPENEN
ncbi:MAG: type II/IV secretion system ATPase subunit [Thermoprotei archaeon]